MLIASNGQSQEISEERIKFIISELTTNPDRQQQALDELVKYGDEALIYLPCYFDDGRPIASTEVKFLNTYPGAFEKYFMTGGQKVSDVIVQYFCWRTKRCDLELSEVEKIKQQLELDSKECKLRHGKTSATS